MKITKERLQQIIQEEISHMVKEGEVDEAIFDFFKNKSPLKTKEESDKEQMKQKIDGAIKASKNLELEAIKQRNREIAQSIRLAVVPMLNGLYKAIAQTSKEKIGTNLKDMSKELNKPLSQRAMKEE